jgi:alkylation response protein AidB-like acyl-CoA dehydrogenase
MDLNLTAEEEEYRAQVRAWLETNLPKRSRGKTGSEVSGLDRARAWQRMVFEAGYLALGWPKEYGGQALDPMRQVIVGEEMNRAGAPILPGNAGITMVGPTLITWGTEQQKRHYLPRILSGEHIWCQGYSEPNAGSDLAALRTSAEIRGDEFIVNGQKIWTSFAHFADMMFALVRTDPTRPKHRGISYVLIDMHSPGITVRPLVQMTGSGEFNEVFFDNVRVPRENLVGELNEGWKVANSTLIHERNMMGSVSAARRTWLQLLETARRARRKGRPAIEDPFFRQRVADLEISVEAMRLHSMRQLTNVIKGRSPGVESLINKLAGTELSFELADAGMALGGSYAALERGGDNAFKRDRWVRHLMMSFAFRISGGSSHIQKNIIAERGLGMPKGR